MPGRDGIQDAVWELFGAEPEEFLRRRAGLAAAARKAGDRDAAKQIAGLRKPTRAAYLINRLARTDPDRVGSLLDLGVELRRAERSVDAAQLRELTARRRRLVEDLAGRVFDIAGADSPTASIRDEVVSTLNAALADDAVAEHVRDGTLVRGAQWAGFGFGSVPDLTVVRTPADGPRPTKPAPVTGVSRRTRTAGQAADQADAQSKADAVAQAKAEAKAVAEEERRQATGQARRVMDEADAAVADAQREEDDQQERLRLLEDQAADARRRIGDARLAIRRAEVQQHKAQRALDRVER